MPETPTPTAKLDSLLFRALLDKAADSIYFKDAQHRFLRVSNRMVGEFNMDHPSQVEGKTADDFFAADHAKELRKAEKEVFEKGLPVLNVEETQTWADGSITWASTSKFPLYDEESKPIGILGISRDITEQKIALEELARTQKELIEQEKKAAVNEFAGMIVTNMGNSLMEITQAVDRASSLIQGIKSNPENAATAQEELREIRHMASRLAALMKMQLG